MKCHFLIVIFNIVKTGSDKHHQWMLSLEGNFAKEQNMPMVLKSLPHIAYKMQGKQH